MVAEQIYTALISEGYDVNLSEVGEYAGLFSIEKFGDDVSVYKWNGQDPVNGHSASYIESTFKIGDEQALLLGESGGIVVLAKIIEIEKEVSEVELIRNELIASLAVAEIWPKCKSHFAEKLPAGIPISPPPTLEEIREAKIKELDSACNTAIRQGFSSAALGDLHTYGFGDEDQANLTGMLAVMTADPAMASTMWMTKDAGPLPHDRDQFLAVCRDGHQHKNAHIARYWGLKAAVQVAETPGDVEAIAW